MFLYDTIDTITTIIIITCRVSTLLQKASINYKIKNKINSFFNNSHYVSRHTNTILNLLIEIYIVI